MRALRSSIYLPTMVGVFIFTSCLLADEIEFHDVKIEYSKALEAVAERMNFSRPGNWIQLDEIERAVLLAGGQPSVGLFRTKIDVLDLCIEDLSRKLNLPESEVSAQIVFDSLDKSNHDALYNAVRVYRHTRFALTIYQSLRDSVLQSEDTVEIQRFIFAFPNSIDCYAAYGKLFLLLEKQSRSANSPMELLLGVSSYGNSAWASDKSLSGLSLITSERIDLSLFAYVMDLSNNLKDPSLTEKELDDIYLACGHYIRRFPDSTNRVRFVSATLAESLERKLDIERLKIDSQSQDLVQRVSAFALRIGLEAFQIFDDASETGETNVMLIGAIESQCRYRYVSELPNKIEMQFPMKVEAKLAASEAVQKVNSLKMLVRIAETLSEVEKTLQLRGDEFRKFELSVSSLNESVGVLHIQFGAGFDAVTSALADLKTNTDSLNSNAIATLGELRAGFTNVSAHIDSCNKKLDGLGRRLQDVNEKLAELGAIVAQGFKGIEATYYDVAGKDLANGRYWELREEGARKYVKEKAVVIRKAILGIFGLLECEFSELCPIPFVCDDSENVDCSLSTELQTKYSQLKNIVFDEFMDDFGMVCNIDETGQVRKFIDQGDSAWRTSLFLACLAMNGDDVNCQKVLKSLNDCWYDGSPHRTPDRSIHSSTQYSTDQFIPHLAALYLCFRYGNPDTRAQAKTLTKRFVDKLAIDDWKLTEDKDAHFNAQRSGGRFFVMLVTKEMGLDRLWLDSIDAGLYGFYRRTWYMAADLRALEAAISTPQEPTSFHNLFWEVLLVQFCEGDSLELQKLKCKLAIGAKRQDMALFMWLANRSKIPCEWLRNWPSNWTVRDYVWQRSRSQNSSPPNIGERYPRIDYLVLASLIKMGRP